MIAFCQSVFNKDYVCYVMLCQNLDIVLQYENSPLVLWHWRRRQHLNFENPPFWQHSDLHELDLGLDLGSGHTTYRPVSLFLASKSNWYSLTATQVNRDWCAIVFVNPLTPDVRVPGCQKLQMTVLTRSGTGCLYSCAHMATVGVKGLTPTVCNIIIDLVAGVVALDVS